MCYLNYTTLRHYHNKLLVARYLVWDIMNITQTYTDTDIVITIKNDLKEVTASISIESYHDFIGNLGMYEKYPRPDPIMMIIDALKLELW